MKILSVLYSRVMGWAEDTFSKQGLAVSCFAGSPFFPIPQDVMLAPMSLAKPGMTLWFGVWS